MASLIPILGRVCVVESCHWNKNVNLYQAHELHDLHNHHQNILGWRKWTNAGCVPVGWMGNKVVSKQMQIGNLHWTNLWVNCYYLKILKNEKFPSIWDLYVWSRVGCVCREVTKAKVDLDWNLGTWAPKTWRMLFLWYSTCILSCNSAICHRGWSCNLVIKFESKSNQIQSSAST